ncbi:break repair meiotic recombinase recruitment factor 1 isoform X2 [Phyllobates terribilis]|uniref:break repair meiotic recombinase recruitment factor 1 isoform X2 n=1 Tax=Phyllobates terribilis TaxID=111132 RepID=UPI003CCA9846
MWRSLENLVVVSSGHSTHRRRGRIADRWFTTEAFFFFYTGSALRNASKRGAMSPGSTSQPAEICGKEDDGRGDHNRKLEAPHQNEEETGNCPSLSDGQLNATNPEVPITVVLVTCHQVEHHDGGDAMVEMTTTDYIRPIHAGTTGYLSPTTATEKTARSVQGPNDTDVTATSITETIEVTGDHRSLMFMDGQCMISNGCESGEACMDQNSSTLREDPNSTSQVSQKFQPLNATPDLHGLSNTPIIPEIISQLQSGIFQSEILVFHGVEERGDEGDCRDPDPLSPEVTCAQQTLRRGAEVIPSQQSDAPEEDSRGAAIGLNLLDSQLLGALEESLYDPGKKSCKQLKKKKVQIRCRRKRATDSHPMSSPITPVIHIVLTPRGEERELPASQPQTRPPPVNDTTVTLLGMDENHISEHQRETLQTATSPPSLPEEAASARGVRDRLIMSTYRELRQKRGRHPPGRGAVGGKRRREK